MRINSEFGEKVTVAVAVEEGGGGGGGKRSEAVEEKSVVRLGRRVDGGQVHLGIHVKVAHISCGGGERRGVVEVRAGVSWK